MGWRTSTLSIAIVSAASLLLATSAHAGNVSVGVSVGVPVPPPPAVVVAPPQIVVPAPPPPVVIAAPPRVVVVPGSPVYYAPGVDFNLFVYGGRQYRFHDGHWFSATSHGGPWTFVARERVPQPVLAVPVTYYKIPPGHAKKMGAQRSEDNGRGPKGKRGKHD
jgi:hypothetical protein